MTDQNHNDHSLSFPKVLSAYIQVLTLRTPKVHTILVAKGYANEALKVVYWYT